jgi:PhnB protein
MKKDAKPPEKDWVIHARLVVGETDIMASDTFNMGYTKPAGMHVALNVDTPAEAERIFKALSEGGQITMKMEETFFAHKFGTVVDKWGTPWMIVSQKPMGG